jgi:beta-glucosidase
MVLPYQDAGLPADERVEDLLARMTVREKAALMFHPPITVPADGDDLADGSARLVEELGISHFDVRRLPSPRAAARWHNRLQERAAATRLGIPVTLSSKPRHAFAGGPAAGPSAGDFSLWPEFVGMAATRNLELVREQADIVRREYLAVGVRVALHPVADLATGCRRARAAGTSGEDPAPAAESVAAYVTGLQGPRLGPDSVAVMVEHLPGGGPPRDGEGPCSPRGRERDRPGGGLGTRPEPLAAAFAAGVSRVVPSYGTPAGTDPEEAGPAFDAGAVRDLLRGRFGFDGIVCAARDVLTAGWSGGTGAGARGRGRGAGHLDVPDRVVRALEAGVDQFGGESRVDVVAGLVAAGRVDEARIDVSARRLLREKFVLGLFDDRRFVDEDEAGRIVGNPEFRARGLEAQCRSMVLLTNRHSRRTSAGGGPALPLRDGIRLYVERVAPSVASRYAKVVADPMDADVALVRVSAPYEPRAGLPGSTFRDGSPEFPPEELDRLLDLAARVPTVVVVRLDRPAVLTELAQACAALVADFGAQDQAVLDVVFGHHAPGGRLPFDLPSSMAAVAAGRPDAPSGTADPLFPLGHGLRY